jgi:hypothetical protein
MRALTKTFTLAALVLLFTLGVSAQSRTTRIYRPCGSQPLSISPRTPAQVTIDATGNINFNPCYQKSINFTDPHAGISGLSWSSLTGMSISAPAYLAGGDFNFSRIVTIRADIAAGTSPGNWYFDRTITAAGTTGNQTIDKIAGTVNIAAGAGTAGVTVTNSLVNANSIVHVTTRTNDATCYVKNVVPGVGSFVIRTVANCTAETSFGFLVTN